MLQRPRSRNRTRRRLALALAAIGMAAAAALVVTVWPSEPRAPTMPDYYGHHIEVTEESPPAARAATAGGVSIRLGCRIGTFGVAPWLRPGKPMTAAWAQRTELALAAMGLPADAARIAVARLRTSAPDDDLTMGNTHGATTLGALYLPIYSTTYSVADRHVVCHASRPNFGDDKHTERGALHRVAVAGQVYHLVVFEKCGNVTRVHPAPLGWLPRRTTGPAAGEVLDIPGQLSPDDLANPGGLILPPAPELAAGAPAIVRHVSEPGTLELALGAAAGMGAIHLVRRARRRKAQQKGGPS